MIAAGLGLMFGMGGGILASINLSRGKLVVANINVTQSIVMLTIVSIIMGILLTVFPETVVTLLGAEGHLTELSAEYLFWFSISIPSTVLLVALPFFVRLTNPNFAMWAMLAATVVNILLDYIFIFILSGDCSVLLSLLIWENWWGHFYSWVICFVPPYRFGLPS